MYCLVFINTWTGLLPWGEPNGNDVEQEIIHGLRGLFILICIGVSSKLYDVLPSWFVCNTHNLGLLIIATAVFYCSYIIGSFDRFPSVLPLNPTRRSFCIRSWSPNIHKDGSTFSTLVYKRVSSNIRASPWVAEWSLTYVEKTTLHSVDLAKDSPHWRGILLYHVNIPLYICNGLHSVTTFMLVACTLKCFQKQYVFRVELHITVCFHFCKTSSQEKLYH
jgi:hypothetical protein